MAKGIHKGTELNNIQETWDQNEKNRAGGDASGGDLSSGSSTTSDDLQRVIQEEAADYDNANKEERILGGDRATVNDDDAGNAGDE